LRSLDFAELRIPLTSIRTGQSEFNFETKNPELEPGVGRRFPDVIRIAAKVTTVGNDFLLDLQVNSLGEFNCDRCGTLFHQKIQGKIHTLFTFQADEADVEDDDVRLLERGTVEIDLQRDVIDALVLAVPAKTICQKSCKGLCPQCGVNLNEVTCQCKTEENDPRWDALRQLKPDN